MTGKRDRKDWPELQPQPGTSEQAFAEVMVKKEAAELHRLLITRIGILKILVVVSLLSAGVALYRIIPELWKGTEEFDAVATPLAAFNAILQVASAGYFVRAKDPDFAASVVKLLLILNGLEVFMGLLYFGGSILFTILNVVLLYLAFRKLQSLRTIWS